MRQCIIQQLCKQLYKELYKEVCKELCKVPEACKQPVIMQRTNKTYI